MHNRKIVKKLLTVFCASAILATTFIPTVAYAEESTENSTENPTLTQSVDVPEKAEKNSIVEAYSDMPNIHEIRTVLISNIHSTSITIGVGEYIRFVPDISGTLSWSSSNSNCSSITSDGILRGNIVGSTTITCTNSYGKKAICNVTVKPAPTYIELNAEETMTLGMGEVYNFKGEIDNGSASSKTSYCSSNSFGLPVHSSLGTATPQIEGKYTVAVVTYNGKKSKCSVTVKQAPTSLSLSKTDTNLVVGSTTTINPVFSTGSYSHKLTVSSSDTSVAEVSVDNKHNISINAKKEGTAKITATTYNGKTATCNVTVKKEAPVTLSISATSTSILRENHAYIKASVTPSDTPVTYTSSNTSVARVSDNGIVTGVGGGTATITVKAGNVTKTCNINVSSYSSDTDMPHSTYTLNNGKSLYLKSIGSYFTSTDTTVATVDQNGFVTAKSAGVAIITADYYGSKKTCALTVIGSEPVRYAYTSPNSASKNQVVTLVAITDTARTAVKFDVVDGNKTTTVNATSKTLNSNGNRYIWKGYYKFTNAGEYSVKAYSVYNDNGKFSTSSGGKTTAFVTDVTSPSTVSYSKRRPSDEILEMNATYEGFLPCVSDDPLVYDAPTVGHGYVVKTGEEFYNNISREEAYAFMVGTMNDSYFSSTVNNYMSNYSLKFNQQQFDALVMLSYNLGAGVLYNDDVKSILTNCWHNGERNLNYVNQYALQRELVQWHHAGGNCIWGLLYRRIDELEVFCYGDYILDGRLNKYGMTYNWYCQ